MRKALIWTTVVIALVAFGACGGGSSGGGKTTKLFGITIGGETDETSVLVLLSPDDGSFIETIGDVGYRLSGLEYDHVTNKLYGSTAIKDAVFPAGLIEIDMGTAAATTIGSGAGMHINNPTVNSAGEMYAWSEDGDVPIMVDPATGVASTIGGGTGSSVHGLAFDGNDDLYFVNGGIEIYTIDTANGAATFFTDLDTDNDYAHHGDFHPETGYYWGIDDYWGNNKADYTPNMIVIDMNTPAIIDSTLTTVGNLHAITFFRD